MQFSLYDEIFFFLLSDEILENEKQEAEIRKIKFRWNNAPVEKLEALKEQQATKSGWINLARNYR